MKDFLIQRNTPRKFIVMFFDPSVHLRLSIDLYHPESIETWIILVKRKLKEGARVRIVEWRRPDSVVPSVPGRYWAYLGAEINNTWFIVGGMNNFSGSGMAAYQTAQNFLDDIRYEPEIKDNRDSLFQLFIDKHNNLESLQPMQTWQKLRTINDFTEASSSQ